MIRAYPYGIPLSDSLIFGYVYIFITMNSGAERFNGLMAMLGIVAGIGAYATTGQMIPGIF